MNILFTSASGVSSQQSQVTEGKDSELLEVLGLLGVALGRGFVGELFRSIFERLFERGPVSTGSMRTGALHARF